MKVMSYSHVIKDEDGELVRAIPLNPRTDTLREGDLMLTGDRTWRYINASGWPVPEGRLFMRPLM